MRPRSGFGCGLSYLKIRRCGHPTSQLGGRSILVYSAGEGSPTHKRILAWKAIAAAYASAKALFECARAKSRVGEADFTPCHPSLRKKNCRAARM